MNHRWTPLAFMALLLALPLGCEADGDTRSTADPPSSSPVDSDSLTTDTATGFLESTDTGAESAPILPDCTGCTGVGNALENLLCAVDLCDTAVLIEQSYTSPTIVDATKLARSRVAVQRFGDASNDLAPRLGGSYALMATGLAKGKAHNGGLGTTSSLFDLYGKSAPDPYSKQPNEKTYDVVEWRVRLKAPENAHGLQIHYVFFSEEYDEYIGREFNDKFYIFLESPSTNGGKKTIINFTACRNPDTYSDFTCESGMPACDEGQPFCYVAVNTALSECCWRDGCKDGPAKTDITGTGFSCGTENVDYIGDYSMGYTYGSSTGWLRTEWPVTPGEELTLTFHLHDTADDILDSEVILDRVVFVTSAKAGTTAI